MTDFKDGDEVWWFEFPDQGLGQMREVILESGIFEGLDHEYIRLQWQRSIRYIDVDVFHSKQEAIDAMLKRLDEFKE